MLNYTDTNIKLLPYHVGLVLLVVANVAFHVEGSLGIYFSICVIAMSMITFTELYRHGFHRYKEPCTLYLTVLYGMYTLYGVLFLRKGTYNLDFMLFTYAQDVCLYIVMRHIFMQRNWATSLSVPFIISSIVIITYLLIKEHDMVFVAQAHQRIGGSLSGNVNTVGSSLGIMSFVLATYYGVVKKKEVFYVLIPLLVVMLLTGSKKTVFVAVLDIMAIYIYEKNKVSSFVKICIVGAFFIWIAMESSYFYDILGKRIDDMLTTMTGLGRGAYSHSTDAREGMIAEAFHLFLDYPLFGGGMNYFWYATVKYPMYTYSHCNYTELLCNYGIIGFLIFYIPYLTNSVSLWRTKDKYWKEHVFGITWLFLSLALGWATVQFSDRCISYIPIIASYAIIESLKAKRLQQVIESHWHNYARGER